MTDGYFHPRNIAAVKFSRDSDSLQHYADDYEAGLESVLFSTKKAGVVE